MHPKNWLQTYLGVAAGLLAATPLAHCQVQTDVFKGDARLEKRIGVRAFGITMAELCAELTKRSGVKFTADPSVAEDKAVFCVHRSQLPNALRVLAEHFDFEWQRVETNGEKSYILRQSAESQRRESDALQLFLNREAENIQMQQKEILEVSRLTGIDRDKRLREIDERIRLNQDPSQAGNLYSLRAALADPHAAKTLVTSELLNNLSRDDILRLFQGKRLAYRWPAMEGARPIPESSLHDMLAAFRADKEAGKFEPNMASVTFTSGAMDTPNISSMVSYTLKKDNSSRGASYGGSSPISVSGLSPLDGVEPRGWREHAELLAPMSFSFERGNSLRVDSTDLRVTPLIGAVMAEIGPNLPMDAVCDVFQTPYYAPFTFENLATGQVITTLSSRFNQTWQIKDGFICLRSRNHEWRRVNEPSATVLGAFMKAVREDKLDLDSLSELAKLPPLQFQSAYVELELSGFRPAGGTILSSRSDLALWAALSPDQREKALNGGISYKELPPETQRTFVAALNDELSAPGSYSGRQENPITLGVASKASLVVEPNTRIAFGYRTKTGSTFIGGGDLKQVVDAARQRSGGKVMDDIRRVETTMIMFRYKADGKTLQIGMLHMPHRWFEVAQPADP